MAEFEPFRFEEDAVACGGRAGGQVPLGSALNRRPHLVRAQMAATRARLQAERVKAWKRWHAEMFEQIRLQGSSRRPAGAPALAPVALEPAVDGPAAPAALVTRDLPPAGSDGAEQAGQPWKPETSGRRWKARPSFERTKAAAAETMIHTEGLLCQPVAEAGEQNRFWSGMIRWVVRLRNADTATRTAPVAPPALAAPAALDRSMRRVRPPWAPLTKATRIAGPRHQPASFSRQEGLAVLEVYLRRMRSHLLAPPEVADAEPEAPTVRWLPVPMASPAEGAGEERPPTGRPGAPSSSIGGMREPWFAIAVFIWAFVMVPLPHFMIERGALPAAVADAIRALKNPLAEATPTVARAPTELQAGAETGARSAAPSAAARVVKVTVAAPDNLEPVVPIQIGLPVEIEDPAAPVLRGPERLAAGEAWSDLYTLGHDLLRAGRINDAIATLRGAAELNPKHPAIRHDLGYMLQQIGDADGAIRHYRVALSLDPEDRIALSNAAFLLHQKGRLEEASTLYARAVSLFPEDPYVAFNYAALLEGQGEVEQARLLFERAAAFGGATKIAGVARARLAQLEG